MSSSSSSQSSASVDGSMSYTVTPTESGTDGDGTVTLRMQNFRSPRVSVSDQARKRKVSTNAPPLGKRRCGGRGSADPKYVTPAQRVKEFPNEEVTVCDGHCAFECYDIISSVSAAVHVAHYPNVEAISQRLAPNNVPLKQQLLDYSKQCMQPAYDYYTQHLQMCH